MRLGTLLLGTLGFNLVCRRLQAERNARLLVEMKLQALQQYFDNYFFKELFDISH